jgi:hypothetical protein
MANQVVLPAQKLRLSDLSASFPNKKIKKIFFQCEIKSISGNDVTFGVIAYAGKRKPGNKWIIGKKVTCQDDPTKPIQSFGIPLAFGNNELVDFNFKIKDKKIDSKNKKQDNLMAVINKILKDPDKAKNTYLLLEARKTENPHIYYDVSLSGLSATTNPSPPAPPQG